MGHIASIELATLDLPSPPRSLAQLSALLANDDASMLQMSRLIETDMGLAAAVMKTLSSPMYGLRGRAQTVQQAVTYLGTREIAALVYQVSLRAAFPAAVQLGINPVHFGVLMTLNLMLGLLTPPVGMVLYAMSSIARVPMMELARELVPFLVSLFVVLALITVFPALVTWLPQLVMGTMK